MRTLFLLILLLPILSKCQNNNPNNEVMMEKETISKWIKAVINVECQSNFFTSKLFVEMQSEEKNNPGKYTKEYRNKIQSNYLKKRYTGTAIYFLHKKKHYLISARHVLEDVEASIQPEIYDLIFLRPNGSDLIDGKILEQDTNYAHYIRTSARQKLNQIPFIFSSKEIDLAIVSLNDIPVYGPQFINTLKNKGYVPITLSDIDTLGNISKNDKILAVGFPNFSEIQQKKLSMDYLNWQSFVISIPVISKGIVEDVTNDTYSYFTGNIFVYRGFSGGPVIADNKLIGISRSYGAFRIKSDNISLGYYLFEKTIFTKTKFIMPMLGELENRLKQN